MKKNLLIVSLLVILINVFQSRLQAGEIFKPNSNIFQLREWSFTESSNYPNVLPDMQSKAVIEEFQAALESARIFAETKGSSADAEFIKDAQENDLKELNILKNKKLTQLTIDEFKTNTELVEEYKKSGNSVYLTIPIEDVKDILFANKNIGTEEPQFLITVAVISGKKDCVGFNIRWVWDKLKNAPNPPIRYFEGTSTTSRYFPAGRLIWVWSEDSEDSSKNGVEKNVTTDTNKTSEVGKPPRTKCKAK